MSLQKRFKARYPKANFSDFKTEDFFEKPNIFFHNEPNEETAVFDDDGKDFRSSNVTKYNRPVGFDEVRLSPFAKVRYLFTAGEYEGGEKRRATDPVWKLEIFDLSHSKVSPDQLVMYYLSGGPKRSFVREELQVVPEDTELPPKNVK